MKLKHYLVLFGVFGSACLMITSCEHWSVYEKPGKHKGYGPPPHAPAHGYRHKSHDGIDIEFDAGKGVYVVVGVSNHYYHKGKYYRFRDDWWETGITFKGEWKSVSERSLPSGLRSETKAKVKTKDKMQDQPGRGLGTKKKK